MQHSWWKVVQTGAASAVNGGKRRRRESHPTQYGCGLSGAAQFRRLVRFKIMRRLTRIGVIFLIVSAWADSGDKERDRITASANVVKDTFNAPDKGIPLSVLDGTKCVIVIPDLKKAAFIVGGDYGRGVMTCRTVHIL